MNYVKIKANSPHIKLSLFVKESDTCKVLKAIQAKHMNTAASGNQKYCPYKGWIDENFLSVSMKRVTLDNNKSRLLKPIVERSLSLITA